MSTVNIDNAIPYSSDQYEKVLDLLMSIVPDQQSPDSFFHTQEMFEWQFKGFGHQDTQTLLLYNHDDCVVGYRGVIPGLYQIPLRKGKYAFEKGNAITGWLMRSNIPEIRGMGLHLHYKIQESLPVTVACCFGTDLTLPIYRISKFSIINALCRYIMPLDIYGYQELISSAIDMELIKQWVNEIDKKIRKVGTIQSENMDAERLEYLWEQISIEIPIFGLFKNREFWNWRYINSPAYKYLFFGDPEELGVIIARIEQIYDRKNHVYDKSCQLYGKKILRIIEVIPTSKEVWTGGRDYVFEKLLCSVIKWSKEQGCLAIDFQHSSDRFSNLLFNAGFREQDAKYGPPLCSLAGLFQPLRFHPKPINVAWRIRSKEFSDVFFEAKDTYFVKSDSSGDHPKYWPLPEGII